MRSIDLEIQEISVGNPKYARTLVNLKPAQGVVNQPVGERVLVIWIGCVERCNDCARDCIFINPQVGICIALCCSGYPG